MSANILDLFASNVTATANGNGSWKDTAEIVDYDVPVLFLFFNLEFAAAGAEGGNYDLYWKPRSASASDPGMLVAQYSTFDEDATKLSFCRVPPGQLKCIVTGSGLNVMPQAILGAG
jgi:hypothetical protein